MLAVMGRIGWNFFAVISIEISHKKQGSDGRINPQVLNNINVNINNHNNSINRGISADLNNFNAGNNIRRNSIIGKTPNESRSSNTTLTGCEYTLVTSPHSHPINKSSDTPTDTPY